MQAYYSIGAGGIYLKRMSRGHYHDSKGNVKALQGRAAKTVGLRELRANFKPPYKVYFGYRSGKVMTASGSGNAPPRAGASPRNGQPRDDGALTGTVGKTGVDWQLLVD